MADEPRRSGRSTKGVNPKNQDEPDPPAPKPKQSTAKSSKSKATAAAVETENDESSDVIRCICGSQDDDGRDFLSCDKCEVWQHNECMGLPRDPDQVDQFLRNRFNSEKYFCEQCKPQNHKDLLAAIKRGERPWEEATPQRKVSKPKKGGRTSKANGTPEVKPPPEVASPALSAQDVSQQPQADKGKRKLAPETEADADTQPSKLRKPSASSPVDSTPQQSRRKSTTGSSPANESNISQPPNAQVPDQPATTASKISDLSNEQRKRTATFLQGKFESSIKELEKRGEYSIPAGQTTSTLAESQAVAVEACMFKNHAGLSSKPDFTGTYRTQMQAIGSNVVQNNALMLRLLSESITPDQLSRMSSGDMASEELQKEMASLKEKADKQATLASDTSNRPLVRRTHKGEEIVESTNHMANESIVSVPPPRRRESNKDSPHSPAIDHPMTESGFTEGPPKRFDNSLTLKTSQSPSSADATRRASNFDMNNVWSSVKSPDADQSPRTGAEPWPASRPSALDHPEIKPENERHAAEIDRLLEEDENDSAPYSPQDYVESKANSDPIWRGLVFMPTQSGSVASFEAESHHVAGTDLQNKVHTLASIYPEKLEISGRIANDRAELYLTSLSASRSTDVTVHSLRATNPDPAQGQAQFDNLFNYFITRGRYGVVSDSLHQPNVSDVYLIPLRAGDQILPSFLERLEFNTVESPVPYPLLLVVFILKWKSGVTPATSATMSTADATPSVPAPPITPAGGYPNSAMPPATPAEFAHNYQPTMTLPHQPANSNAYPTHQPTPSDQSHTATVSSDLYYHNLENAKQVLGELVHCSTAQQILRGTQEPVAREVLENLLLIFEREPRSRDDFTVFQTELAKPRT